MTAWLIALILALLGIPAPAPVTWDALPYGATVAHRGGAMLAPENTMTAFRLAADAPSVGALELDVHLLADGGIGVIHDGVTATGVPVSSLTSEEFMTTGHPLLAEVLTEFGDRERLLIETKTPDVTTPLINALNASQVSADSVVVQSFNPVDLHLAELDGYDTMHLGTTDVAAAAAASAEWIAPSLAQLTPELVAAAHAAGIRVAVWTIRTPEDHALAESSGPDAIMSDTPW